MVKDTWREADPLYRGDCRDGPVTPVPKADRSIVRHILYLGGAGRPSPYLSTTESSAIAREKYAGPKGIVRVTYVLHARNLQVGHIDRLELLDLLRGKGKGEAKGHRPAYVAQARRHVEESKEHLLDFGEHEIAEPAAMDEVVRQVFAPPREPSK